MQIDIAKKAKMLCTYRRVTRVSLEAKVIYGSMLTIILKTCEVLREPIGDSYDD